MEILAQYLPADHKHQLGAMDAILLLETMEQKGVDVNQLLEDVGLDPVKYAGQYEQWTYADKFALFKYIKRLYPNDALGLMLGKHATLSHFGVLGYALSTSQNVLEAIKSGFKYLQLNGPIFSVKVVSEGHEASIVIENTLDIGDLLPFCCEYFFSSIVTLFEEMTGDKLTTTRLSLPYYKPTYGDEYGTRFRCVVDFERPICELRFDAAVLCQPLPTHDASVLKRYLSSCDSIIETLDSKTLLTNQIKTLFYQTVGNFPSLEQIASDYGCSSRTLRRELLAHDSAYQLLLDEVRLELAKEFLIATTMSIEDIGEKLGYKDPANFRRAFKRWLNKTPSQFRTQFA